MRIDLVLRAARKRARLSQAQLAARAGTSQPAVARYERGRAVPSLGTLDRLLAAVDGSVVLGRSPGGRAGDRRGSRGGLAFVRDARQRLLAAAGQHGVRDIRVFGSVARGDETAASDVDLLVDLETDRTLLDLIAFRQEAEEILGVRVDAVAPRFMKDRVRDRALQDARPL